MLQQDSSRIFFYCLKYFHCLEASALNGSALSSPHDPSGTAMIVSLEYRSEYLDEDKGLSEYQQVDHYWIKMKPEKI